MSFGRESDQKSIDKVSDIAHNCRKMSIFAQNWKQMRDSLNVAYRLRIFTLRELMEAEGGDSPLQTSKVLQRWQQQGLAVQVRRNLYCMVDLFTGLPVCDKYEIGSHLSESSYISYHSALEFHGLAHQPFNEIFVSSNSRFHPFCFEDVDYICCRQAATNKLGVTVPAGNPFTRVTDVERTLLDCFDRIDRAGGPEELSHCLEGVVMLSEDKLVAYLDAFDKAFLYQKSGYLLERIKKQAHISDSFLKMCREKGTKSVKWLTNNDESDTFVNRWRLYVPQVLTENKLEYEFV